MNRINNELSGFPKTKKSTQAKGISAYVIQPDLKSLRRRASCSLLFSILALACNISTLLIGTSISLDSPYAIELRNIAPNVAAVAVILAQVFAVLTTEQYLKAKKQHIAKVPPVGLTAIVVCGLIGLFVGYGISAALVLLISFVIIKIALQKESPAKFLLNAATIASSLCGILVLLAWMIPLIMGKQMAAAGADGFGLILELVYAPFYNIFRVEAAVPVVLGFICLIRARRVRGEDIVLRLILMIIAAIMVLSPVFYSVTRRAMKSSGLAQQIELVAIPNPNNYNDILQTGETNSNFYDLEDTNA